MPHCYTKIIYFKFFTLCYFDGTLLLIVLRFLQPWFLVCLIEIIHYKHKSKFTTRVKLDVNSISPNYDFINLDLLKKSICTNFKDPFGSMNIFFISFVLTSIFRSNLWNLRLIQRLLQHRRCTISLMRYV